MAKLLHANFSLYRFYAIITWQVELGSGHRIEIPEDFRQAARNTNIFCFPGTSGILLKKFSLFSVFKGKSLFDR